MNRKRVLLQTLLVAGALGFNLALAEGAKGSVDPASAKTQCVFGSPTEKTKEMIAKLLDVLKQDQASIKGNFAKVESDVSSVLSPHIDIDKIANFVVPAELMKQATEEERKQFRSVLLTFFISSYSAAFKSFTDKVHVEVSPLRPGMEKRDTLQINTTVFTDDSGNANSMIPVALVLMRDNAACQWKYVDFVVDNISAVSNVQSQIASLKMKSLVELKKYIEDHNNAVAKGM